MSTIAHHGIAQTIQFLIRQVAAEIDERGAQASERVPRLIRAPVGLACPALVISMFSTISHIAPLHRTRTQLLLIALLQAERRNEALKQQMILLDFIFLDSRNQQMRLCPALRRTFFVLMSRYYVDVYDGALLSFDCDGIELQDSEAAREHAAGTMRDIERELTLDGIRRASSIAVRNGAGALVCSMTSCSTRS